MKHLLSFLFYSLTWLYATAQDIQLAPPQASLQRVFATATGSVAFSFRMAGADIRYTTDGSTPSDTSARYEGPIAIDTTMTIKARSFCRPFLPSDICQVEVISSGKPIGGLSMPPPSEKYQGSSDALMNSKLGSNNLQEEWLGYQQSRWRCYVYPMEGNTTKQVAVSMIQRQGSWIFLPQAISILNDEGTVLGTTLVEGADMASPDGFRIIRVDIPEGKYRELQIRMEGLPALPEWHAGKGQMPWLFMDEILLY